MQEASKLVHLALNLNVWSGILLEEGVVLEDFLLQLVKLGTIVFNKFLLLQYLYVLALPKALSHRFDLIFNL